MIKTLGVCLAALIALASNFARADVNAANGSFFHRLRLPDNTASADGNIFPVVALYEHQNQNAGLFGQGWCSELEHSLRIDAPKSGEVTFVQCGSGRQIQFKKEGKNYQVSGTGAAPGDFPKLEANYEGFVLSLSPYERFRFDSKGALAEIDRDRKSLKIIRNTKLWALFDETGKELYHLTLDGPRVVALKFAGQEYHFKFSEKNLTAITGPNGFERGFSYDQKQRMNEVSRHDGDGEKVEFDDKLNVVKTVAHGSCVEKLEFKLEKVGQYSMVSAMNCAGKTSTRRFSFAIDDKDFVQSESDDAGKRVFRQIENPLTGQLRVSDTADGQHEEYDGAGNLRFAASAKEMKFFDFDAHGRLIKVERKDSAGAVDAQINYQNKSNLIKTISVDRELVALGYTQRGEIEKFSYRNVVARKTSSKNQEWTYFIGEKIYQPGTRKISFLEASRVLTVQEAMSAFQQSERARKY